MAILVANSRKLSGILSGRLSGKTTKSNSEGAAAEGGAFLFVVLPLHVQLFFIIHHYLQLTLPLTLPLFATKIATKCRYTSISKILCCENRLPVVYIEPCGSSPWKSLNLQPDIPWLLGQTPNSTKSVNLWPDLMAHPLICSQPPFLGKI